MCSCGIETKFNKDELKWLNVYNVGDTLIFKSDKGKLDTSIIIKKDLYYPDYNPIEVHDKYLPQWGVVWYKNRSLEYHKDGYALISMIKKHPNNNTFLSIDYLYSSVLISNLTTSSIEKVNNGKVYIFDTYHPKGEPYQPRTIYWHEDFGIIEYVTHDSTKWKRIDKSF